MSSILATQALAMTILQTADATTLRRDRKHAFATLNDFHTKKDELYDGSKEEYMSFRVAKIDYDQWKMRIRFRKNTLSEQRKNISEIDDYAFDWLRDGNRQAWRSSVLVSGGKTTREEWTDMYPLSEEGVDYLQKRMVGHHKQSATAKALHASRRSE